MTFHSNNSCHKMLSKLERNKKTFLDVFKEDAGEKPPPNLTLCVVSPR